MIWQEDADSADDDEEGGNDVEGCDAQPRARLWLSSQPSGRHWDQGPYQGEPEHDLLPRLDELDEGDAAGEMKEQGHHQVMQWQRQYEHKQRPLRADEH